MALSRCPYSITKETNKKVRLTKNLVAKAATSLSLYPPLSVLQQLFCVATGQPAAATETTVPSTEAQDPRDMSRSLHRSTRRGIRRALARTHLHCCATRVTATFAGRIVFVFRRAAAIGAVPRHVARRWRRHVVQARQATAARRTPGWRSRLTGVAHPI